MPTAQHHNFKVKNGLEVNDSIKLGNKTITNLYKMDGPGSITGDYFC